MTQEKLAELKSLGVKELDLRIQWEDACKEFNKLNKEINAHNEECCKFWEDNLPDALEIAVVMENDYTFNIKKPIRELAEFDSTYPQGIVFQKLNTQA